MKYFLIISAALILFSCDGLHERMRTDKALKSCDRLLSGNPYRALGNLRQISRESLTESQEAYYRLLYTIALIKTDGGVPDISDILQTVRWYEKSGDYENYARALFYSAIAADRMAEKSPGAFSEPSFKMHSEKSSEISYETSPEPISDTSAESTSQTSEESTSEAFEKSTSETSAELTFETSAEEIVKSRADGSGRLSGQGPVNATACDNPDRIINNTIDTGENNFVNGSPGEIAGQKRVGTDTAAFSRVKKAEWIMKTHKIRNAELEGEICRYLGDVNFINKNYREAEYYVRKSIRAYDRLHDTLNLISGYDNLFWALLGQGPDRFIAFSGGMPGRPVQDNRTKIRDRYAADYLMSSKSVWLGRKNEILRSLEALGEEEEVNFYDMSLSNFSLARNFDKRGYPDSALFYARQSVEDITDTLNYNSCIIYNFYAGLLSRRGDYKTACTFLNKALDGLEKNKMSRERKKILELEKKYNVVEKENEILRIRSRTHKLSLMILLLGGLSGSLFFIFLQNRRNLRQSVEIAEKNLEIARLNEERLLKMRIINKLLEINSGMFPLLSGAAYDLALKSYGSGYECAEKILEKSSELKKKAKMDLREALICQDIEKYVPYYKELSVFGEKERLIIILSDLGCNSKNIENIIQSSAGTIRSLKSRIREKLEKNDGISAENKRKILDLLG